MENMYTVNGNCLFVKMPKEMDHHSADDIRMKVDMYIIKDSIQNVIFDFQNTSFMDSSGIGLIVGRYKKVMCFGGRVVAIHANQRIQKILLMSGLKDKIEIM